ncbi:MAG TPA: amidohydrolase family protein [Streptosporangiaceae bacterium]|jgi:cytosine deaminase
MDILLRGGRDATGAPLDVLMAGDRIAATGAAATAPGGQPHVIDVTGRVLLPAPAEAHAHLDKALLGSGPADPGAAGQADGTLTAALRAMRTMPMTRDAIARRARRAAMIALRHGFTAIRAHVDLGLASGRGGVETLAELKRDLCDVLDLQIVGLVCDPIVGRDGFAQRDRLRAALASGCDVVGGAPWLSQAPDRAIAELTAAAADAGLPIDLHLDETTDVGTLTLTSYLKRVEQLGLGGRATASHCVSLGQQDPDRARTVARALARAGVSLVVLPQTNLGLQGRGLATRVPRALAPIGLLEQAGVLVAAGGDNWRDPFNPVGRIDPMETASLLVSAGHLAPARAYELVSTAARAVLGLPPAALRAGQVADLLAIRAESLGEAVASGTEDRMVWHRGRLVADTRVSTCFNR